MTLTAKEYHGGCVEITFGNNGTIKLGEGRRLQVMKATSSNLTLTLPPVTNPEVPVGVNVLWVANIGSNPFTIVDVEGAVNELMSVNEVGAFHVVRNLAGQYRFYVRTSSIL